MNKTIGIITASLLLAISSIAQQGEKAGKILDELAEKNKSYETIQADFDVKYKNLQGGDETTHSGGRIAMKGDKYKLKLNKSTIYYDGETQWNHLRDVNEVNISEPTQDKEEQDFINHPNKLFELYEKDFKYKYLEKTEENNKSYHKIDLYPKDLEEDYSRIRLMIEAGNIQIQSAKIFGKDGARYTIIIKNMEVNEEIPDSTFVFNKDEHPDAEVIDMRF
ncbi:MAG: LolA family protein [Bacteroidota bacterium]